MPMLWYNDCRLEHRMKLNLCLYYTTQPQELSSISLKGENMLNKEEAEKWAGSMIKDGTYEIQKEYIQKFGAGQIAKDLWFNTIFTYGIEYGILIAVKKIFGELD